MHHASGRQMHYQLQVQLCYLDASSRIDWACTRIGVYVQDSTASATKIMARQPCCECWMTRCTYMTHMLVTCNLWLHEESPLNGAKLYCKPASSLIMRTTDAYTSSTHAEQCMYHHGGVAIIAEICARVSVFECVVHMLPLLDINAQQHPSSRSCNCYFCTFNF
jgi:hypothetical protein